ncbi:MAG: tRNA pseudouridine(55) synthase TruB [Rhodospirillales bacterium]
MGRRRGGKPISGWLVIDKPSGMTSAQVVARVRGMTGAAKAGHGGTLDPMATGVLPIALGEATKTVSYVMDGEKRYRFTLTFGEARDTDDAEGEVTEISAHRPDDAAVRAVIPRFTGVIEQVPPAYSAIKVGGRRAYDLARRNEAPELAPRPVDIKALHLTDRPGPDTAVFECVCGKGAYIRALARDMARALGSVGHVSALRRAAVGPFDEKDAISLDHAAFNPLHPALDLVLRPVETVLDDIPALALTETEAARLRNGQPVALLPVAQRGGVSGEFQGEVVSAMAGGRMVALVRIVGGEIRTVRVIHDTPGP